MLVSQRMSVCFIAPPFFFVSGNWTCNKKSRHAKKIKKESTPKKKQPTSGIQELYPRDQPYKNQTSCKVMALRLEDLLTPWLLHFKWTIVEDGGYLTSARRYLWDICYPLYEKFAPLNGAPASTVCRVKQMIWLNSKCVPMCFAEAWCIFLLLLLVFIYLF